MDLNGKISATFTDGVFKPDEPLYIPEGSRFRMMLQPLTRDPIKAAKAMETIQRIRASGVFRSDGRKLTRDEMHERD